MGAPRAQSFAAAQGGSLAASSKAADAQIVRSQSFTAQGTSQEPSVPPAASEPRGRQPPGQWQKDGISSNMPDVCQPSAGPARALRPMELRELSTEVPREPSWPSEGQSSWKQAEASTPTSLSSGAQAAAGESQRSQRSQHTSGTAQVGSSPMRAEVGSESLPDKNKCTPKNPFWVQPEVPQKKGSRRSSDGGLNSYLSSAAPLRCLSDVVDAGDRNYEIEIAEEDLTTVHISSWEQRLDWRSFLSEAVASSLARQAFMNFDVEAEPPPYARPPPSSKASESPRHQPTSNRHCVAPDGSGWMQPS